VIDFPAGGDVDMPAKGDSGWAPHRDMGRTSLFDDGSPKCITTWIPLSSATPLNGCMYIVPALHDPTYATADEANWKVDPSSVRALPANPGDFLVWNQAVHIARLASELVAGAPVVVGTGNGRVPPPYATPAIHPNGARFPATSHAPAARASATRNATDGSLRLDPKDGHFAALWQTGALTPLWGAAAPGAAAAPGSSAQPLTSERRWAGAGE
jgi:hypothetical protein